MKVQGEMYIHQSSTPVAERDFSTSAEGAHLRYRLSPLYETVHGDVSSEISGISVVCTDVTAMVNAELALRRSQEERDALVASATAAKVRNLMLIAFSVSLMLNWGVGSISAEDRLRYKLESRDPNTKSVVFLI